MNRENFQVIDCEIRPLLEEVLEANAELSKNPSPDNQELVCIKTRAAWAVFYDVSCWAGAVNESSRKALIDAFSQSLQLLTDTKADGRIITAVAERLENVKTLDVEKEMHAIAS